MLKKVTYSAGIAFSILILLLSSASAAITFYQTDGVWGRVDDGYDGIVFDVVGVIGVDPGTAWTGTSGQTTAGALIRNSTVCTHDSNGDANLSEWTASTTSNLGLHTFDPDCDYQGLFISEYRQGTTDAIEIYNNMGQEVDLADKNFSIQIFANGSTTPTNIALTGTIAAGGTYVIASAEIASVVGEQISTSLSFSGDDAVALVRDYISDQGNTDGATSLQYATGPTGLNPTGTTGLQVSTNPSVQTGPTTDFNQIRYGNPTQWPYDFSKQSGLTFQGINNQGETYADENAFLAGKFCHVNNPISAENSFNDTYMTLTLTNIGCGEGAVAPFPPPTLTFVYPVNLDETSNSGNSWNCPYPSGWGNPCSDAVTFYPTDATFTCFYEGDVVNTYTVAILGFNPITPDGNCTLQPYDPGDTDGIFISDEGSTNCGCLFAMITEAHITAVDLISFDAESDPEGVKLSWETATETDNLGFNLYRSDSLTSDKVQLNDTLIPPNVPPGSPFGAAYEFVDTGATAFQTYFYWLEDIDASGEITLHGPAIVTRP